MSPSELIGRCRNAAQGDAWGYFGEASRFRDGATKDEELARLDAVDEAVGAALLGLGVKEAESIEFLRSRMGRHLSDAVLTVGTLGGKPIAQHVREHLEHFLGEKGSQPRRRTNPPKLTLAGAEAIAKRHLAIETLTTRGQDRLDFHEVSVVAVRDVIEAAYQAGWTARGGAR